MADGQNVDQEKCCSCIESGYSPRAADVKLQENPNCQDEEIKRLKKSYDEMVNRNQELEAKVLEMAEELQIERTRYQEGLLSMAEKLVDATETVNRLERELVRNRKDCNLVVQLLKCHQSLDKGQVLKEVEQLSSDLQNLFCKELGLDLPKDDSRKVQRSLSTSDLYSPPGNVAPVKSILKKRSHSSVNPPVVANGHVTFKDDLPANKKKGFRLFSREKHMIESDKGKNNNSE